MLQSVGRCSKHDVHALSNSALSPQSQVQSIETFCTKETVVRAGVLWVDSKPSLHSYEDVGQTFSLMFPNSAKF